jgi:ADP-heptose:LPS heptosyltransferase
MLRALLFPFDPATALMGAYLHWGQPRSRKRVAIFKPDGIGDFVLSSEALKYAINFYGSAHVSLFVPHQLVDLAQNLFAPVEIIPIVPGHAQSKVKLLGLPQLRSALRCYAYEEVICLRHYRTRYEDVILRALHASRVTLLRNQSASAAAADSRRTPTPEHFNVVQAAPSASLGERENIPREWLYHAAVLSEALKRPISAESLRPNWDKWKRSVNAGNRFLLVAPLAGRQIRDIPPSLVIAAVRRVASTGLHHVVLTGSKAQSGQLRSYVEAVSHALPHSRIEVAHPPNIPSFVDLVAKAALVVAAESSAAHIATALDKPALILIGGGHYGWFAPWRRSDKQVWLTNKLPCFDCNWRCLYPKPVCITDVTAAQVEAALPVAE